ncbi:MAG: endonuclease III, partial [bacterium]|nr:endonuclease III [bacterium]
MAQHQKFVIPAKAGINRSENQQEIVIDVLNRLKKAFPEQGGLAIGNSYQCLVAVLLSARTRDEQVLKLLPALFDRFPDAHALAGASKEEILPYISSIGMFRQKATHLVALGIMLCDTFGGEVPKTMEELIQLPGVGRKTASVLLPYAFNEPAIAVDTHVHRVTKRLGWVKSHTPASTETQLLELIPDENKRIVNQVFVPFGRYICIKNPRCWACPIAD